MRSAKTSLLLSCSILCGAVANLALGQAVTPPGSNVVPAFRADAFAPTGIPADLVGVWQVQIEGRPFKLKNNYNIEFKINDGRGRLPAAIVSYFVGDPARPSTICQSQLTLVSTEGAKLVFAESKNRQGGKDYCPIWDQVAIESRSGQLWFEWRDAGRRKATTKMKAGAYRWTGGMECRLVSGDGGSGGQEWCRDAEGNWSPRRR